MDRYEANHVYADSRYSVVFYAGDLRVMIGMPLSAHTAKKIKQIIEKLSSKV